MEQHGVYATGTGVVATGTSVTLYVRDPLAGQASAEDAIAIALAVNRNPVISSVLKLPDYPFLTEDQYKRLPAETRRLFEARDETLRFV